MLIYSLGTIKVGWLMYTSRDTYQVWLNWVIGLSFSILLSSWSYSLVFYVVHLYYSSSLIHITCKVLALDIPWVVRLYVKIIYKLKRVGYLTYRAWNTTMDKPIHERERQFEMSV